MAKQVSTYQKLRGGYYTPQSIGVFLANWAIQSPDIDILEPSYGDGALLACIFDRLRSCGLTPEQAAAHIHGFEIDADEAQKAADRFRDIKISNLCTGDFFPYAEKYIVDGKRFDAVIGNPPFIRYQNFPASSRDSAFRLMRAAGLHPNRLTNAWLPFLAISTLLLNAHGRLAMVIPAELLQVNYASELRQFLSRFYRRITLVTFEKLVFEGIQQEVVLLLGERDGASDTGIKTIELVNRALC